MNAIISSLNYGERAQSCRVLVAKQLFQLLHEKQTNLAFSADVTSQTDLLSLADLVGPEICLLKTHIDIIDDFTIDLLPKLRALAKKHRFMLFEDRKFADIGNTVKQQYQGGLYRISNWAHLVNAHSLPGPGIIAGLAAIGQKKNRGLLLLAEMSSINHLMDATYRQKTLELAEQFPEFVVGFITQRALTAAPYWINFTPGVQLTSGKDALGQQYVTPYEAIFNNGADVLIVGRGILNASDPLTESRQYRKAGWDAYLQRCAMQ